MGSRSPVLNSSSTGTSRPASTSAQAWYSDRRASPVPCSASSRITSPSLTRTTSPISTATRWPSTRNGRSEEHTSELQSPCNLVCRLLLEKKKGISEKHTSELQSHTNVVSRLLLEKKQTTDVRL